MLQLIDLVLGSFGGMIVAGLRDTVYAVMILADCDECGFNDLGKLLFGGVILAVLIGVAGSLLWRRVREKNSSSSAFVSIRDDRE